MSKTLMLQCRLSIFLFICQGNFNAPTTNKRTSQTNDVLDAFIDAIFKPFMKDLNVCTGHLVFNNNPSYYSPRFSYRF